MTDENKRLADKVAIVTGAGRGLGRAEALALAGAGAKVVVNDFGGSTTGLGERENVAQLVVDEIKVIGGEAVVGGSLPQHHHAKSVGIVSLVEQIQKRRPEVRIAVGRNLHENPTIAGARHGAGRKWGRQQETSRISVCPKARALTASKAITKSPPRLRMLSKSG